MLDKYEVEQNKPCSERRQPLQWEGSEVERKKQIKTWEENCCQRMFTLLGSFSLVEDVYAAQRNARCEAEYEAEGDESNVITNEKKGRSNASEQWWSVRH